MIATAVGHDSTAGASILESWTENETHDDQDRAALLEALARQSSVANPRRTRR